MRVITIILALSIAAPALAKDLVIHAGTLLDGVSATPRHEVSILIKDDRITDIQPGFVSPAGAEIVDLSKATVMPGFIDCHVHVSQRSPGGENQVESAVIHNEIDIALNASK